jgi:hypothetical protein
MPKIVSFVPNKVYSNNHCVLEVRQAQPIKIFLDFGADLFYDASHYRPISRLSLALSNELRRYSHGIQDSLDLMLPILICKDN